MMNRIFIFYLSVFGFTKQVIAECKLKNNGTTKNLKEIFMGRCYSFLNLRQGSNCHIDPKNYNCTKIWQTFEAASTGKTPCNIHVNDYENFLNLVNHSIPVNSTFFYSGTYGVAQDCKKI
jgi:ADP-ribosyl cyclase 1